MNVVVDGTVAESGAVVDVTEQRLTRSCRGSDLEARLDSHDHEHD